MITFSISVTKRIDLDAILLSDYQRARIAMAGVESMKDRIINKLLDVYDDPVKSLNEAYKKAKIRQGAKPEPDLVYTGGLMRDMDIKFMNSEKIIVGPVSQKNAIKAAVNQARRHQLGFSPSDIENLEAEKERQLAENIRRMRRAA